MATATVYSSVPTAPYDIHPNDFLNQNYQVPNDGTFGMGTAESFYPPHLNEAQTPTFPYSLQFQHPDNLSYFKPPQVGLVPTFPTNRVTYSGGLQPTSQPYNAVPHHLQSQSLSTTVLSPSCDPSTSLQGALTLSAASLRKKIQKTNKKSKGKGKSATGNVTQSAKRELLSGNPRRKRRPNKRPPGTSFSDLLDGLPHEVRKALEEEYMGCCDSINTKDVSIKQKHWFTNRHCLNLPEEYQEAVPNFVCPAFLAFNNKCRAKVGRYDSTERHCQNCAGFQEISSGQNEAFPVEITRSGYRDIQIIQTALAEKEIKGKGEATKLAMDSVRRMLAALFKDGLPVVNHEEDESNGSARAVSGAILDHPAQPEPTAPPPTTSEPVLEPECAEWDFDASQMTKYYESNVSGGIVDHTAPPPTTSEPVVEPESADKWDFDTLLDHAAPPPTTSGPVFEPDSVEWSFDNITFPDFLQD